MNGRAGSTLTVVSTCRTYAEGWLPNFPRHPPRTAIPYLARGQRVHAEKTAGPTSGKYDRELDVVAGNTDRAEAGDEPSEDCRWMDPLTSERRQGKYC